MKHSLLLPDRFLIALFSAAHKTMNFRPAGSGGPGGGVVNLIQSRMHSHIEAALALISTIRRRLSPLYSPWHRIEGSALLLADENTLHISWPMYYITALIHIRLSIY